MYSVIFKGGRMAGFEANKVKRAHYANGYNHIEFEDGSGARLDATRHVMPKAGDYISRTFIPHSVPAEFRYQVENGAAFEKLYELRYEARLMDDIKDDRTLRQGPNLVDLAAVRGDKSAKQRLIEWAEQELMDDACGWVVCGVRRDSDGNIDHITKRYGDTIEDSMLAHHTGILCFLQFKGEV